MNKMNVIAVMILLLLVFSRGGQAATSDINTKFGYKLKFLCGTPDQSLVAGSNYATAIIIFNPGPTPATIVLNRVYFNPDPVEINSCQQTLDPLSVVAVSCNLLATDAFGGMEIESTSKKLFVSSVISAAVSSTDPPTVLSSETPQPSSASYSFLASTPTCVGP